MALSTDVTKFQANAIENVCTELAAVLAKINVILDHNSDMAIDWAADPKPAYIEEDADGNIASLRYDRSSVANAIGSLDQVRRLMSNEAATQGDHLGNINKLSRPMPLR